MKKIDKVLVIYYIAFIALCIAPVIIISAYSVLAADDFSHAISMEVESRGILEYILASFMFAKTKYMTWQGTYFSMFIQALLSPLNAYGLPQLRLVMLSNTVLFFCSLLFFSWSWMKEYVGKCLLFSTWGVGILINAGTLGNFARQKNVDETRLHPLSALFMAIEDYGDRLQWFIENSGVIGILGIIVLGTIIFGENKKVNKNYVLITIFL